MNCFIVIVLFFFVSQSFNFIAVVQIQIDIDLDLNIYYLFRELVPIPLRAIDVRILEWQGRGFSVVS